MRRLALRIGLVGAVLALHGGVAAMMAVAMDSQPKTFPPPTETLTILLQDPEPEPPPAQAPAPVKPEKADPVKPAPKPVAKPRPVPKVGPDPALLPSPAAPERTETVPAAASPAPPTSPVSAEARTQPKPAADQPTMLTCQKPPYPAQSRRAGETGTVEVMLLVDREGRVTEKTVARSSGYPALDQAALEGLARCHFKPGTIDGRVEPAWLRLRYVWKLE